MRAPGARQLGEPICEVAKGRTADDGDYAESGDGDAGASVQAVQQKYKPNHRCGRDSYQSDADCHGSSVDHVTESITSTRTPRPKPMKKPKAVARSISGLARPAKIAP